VKTNLKVGGEEYKLYNLPALKDKRIGISFLILILNREVAILHQSTLGVSNEEL
jgi:hypothetical protein